MSRISIKEDLIIAALRSALASNVQIETRNVPLTEQELKQLIGKAPFVYIEFNGAERIGATENGKVTSRRNYFNFFVASKSLRTMQESQRGAYDLLDDIFEVLDGVTISDDMDKSKFVRLSWRSEGLYFDSAEGGTVYQAVYEAI